MIRDRDEAQPILTDHDHLIDPSMWAALMYSNANRHWHLIDQKLKSVLPHQFAL